jgi:hypothetical protein
LNAIRDRRSLFGWMGLRRMRGAPTSDEGQADEHGEDTPKPSHLLTIGQLGREWYGSRSGECGGEAGKHDEVGVERDLLDAANPSSTSRSFVRAVSSPSTSRTGTSTSGRWSRASVALLGSSDSPRRTRSRPPRSGRAPGPHTGSSSPAGRARSARSSETRAGISSRATRAYRSGPTSSRISSTSSPSRRLNPSLSFSLDMHATVTR